MHKGTPPLIYRQHAKSPLFNSRRNLTDFFWTASIELQSLLLEVFFGRKRYRSMGSQKAQKLITKDYRIKENFYSISKEGMFSLFYGLWKYIFSKTEFHVLILGIDKAGKTTLLEKLKTMYSESEGLPPDRIVPTVGLNIGRGEASKSKLVFWDLGGQLGLRTIWEKYYEEAHAVMYVVDAACQSRFEDTKSALEKALRHEDLQGAPILIFANKQDLTGAVSAEELARYLDLKELNERPYMYQAISAYDGSGIREGVNWLVDAMRRSKRSELLRHRADMAMAVAV